MQRVTIDDGRRTRFTVESYGNGLAYEIRQLDGDKSVFLQGDDATAFREDYDTADNLAEETAAIRAKAFACSAYFF